ncbi:hypothetical protein C9374_009253 [Naegleria lovaniensis]|uniref:Uncharacterized protein n=1 Tax=Naegleria lovaniensis TaxID=51637 RepID=A0AA88GH83_NAELO|nr:uncharacterized protein C9374_009253 [Naegleria lovaniensis]KAG2377342.1 hypothetical protein C9374_009253 [Naegleria lovaniensis]
MQHSLFEVVVSRRWDKLEQSVMKIFSQSGSSTIVNTTSTNGSLHSDGAQMDMTSDDDGNDPETYGLSSPHGHREVLSNDLSLYLPCLTRQYHQSPNHSTGKSNLFNILHSHRLFEQAKLCNDYRIKVNWDQVQESFIQFLMSSPSAMPQQATNIAISFEEASHQNRTSLILREIFGSTSNTQKSTLFCNDVYCSEICNLISSALFQIPLFLFSSGLESTDSRIAAIARVRNQQSPAGGLTWYFRELIRFLFLVDPLAQSGIFDPSLLVTESASSGSSYSEKYIISIVLNHPYILEDLIEFLIREFATNNQYMVRLESILKQLSSISRSSAEKVRFYCMKFRKFSELCLYITFEKIRDYVGFFNSCFNGVLESGNLFSETKSAELAIFESVKKNPKIQEILSRHIVAELQGEETSVADTCSLLRLCCALMLLSSYNVFKNDFSLVIASNHNLPVSIHLTKLRFSFLFICGENITASLSSDLTVIDLPKSNIVQVLRDFIRSLMEVSNSMSTSDTLSSHDKTTIKNILLLLATNFHAQLYKSIATFVLDTLHPTLKNAKHLSHNASSYSSGSGGQQTEQTKIPSNKLSRQLLDENTLKRQLGDRIANLFVSELFPVEKLAHDILTVTPLPFYTADNDYVLQCVFRMLKSRLFRKHSVDASDWVFQQVRSLYPVNEQITLHHLIPKIIHELIHSNCIPYATMPFDMKLFNDEMILDVFESNTSNQISRALILYYILSVNNSVKKHRYGPTIIEKCNVVEVVKYVKEHRKQVGVFYSQLLSAVEELQYLFHLETLLSEGIFSTEAVAIGSLSDSDISNAIQSPMSDQAKTKLVLDELRISSPELSQQHMNEIIYMLDISNKEGLMQNFQDVRYYVFLAFQEWWKWMFSKTNPMRLALQTANVLVQKESGELKYYDIYQNILLLFRVDQRIFQCPPLLDIFLQMLSLFMSASRKFILQSTHSDAGLKDTLIKTQESSILQLLLEYLNPRILNNGSVESDKPLHEDDGSTDMRIVQRKICQFIHQRFIENPTLSKLIHFQTYNPALLPITVSLIDSIHICMDFILELLNQPKVNQQMFAVQLASYLCEKYPLQRYIDIARAAITKLKQIAHQRSALISSNFSAPEGSIDLFSSKQLVNQQEDLNNAQEILETLLRLSRAFPFLCLECIQVVHELKTVFSSKPKVLLLVQQYFVKLTTSTHN